MQRCMLSLQFTRTANSPAIDSQPIRHSSESKLSNTRNSRGSRWIAMSSTFKCKAVVKNAFNLKFYQSHNVLSCKDSWAKSRLVSPNYHQVRNIVWKKRKNRIEMMMMISSNFLCSSRQEIDQHLLLRIKLL